jgi:hypothetical protein
LFFDRRDKRMSPRAIIPFAVICLTGMLFPQPELAVARGGFGGGFGGFHGGMMGFHGGMNGFRGMPPMGPHSNARFGRPGRDGNKTHDMRDARSRRDGSRFNEARFGGPHGQGMHGANARFARWNSGQWNSSSGFGGGGRGPAFQGEWRVSSSGFR